jgi:uncharacterized protein (TIGR02453 family)
MEMQKIIDFLVQLQQNNCREWFHAHKTEYKVLEEEFHVFVEQLILGIASFDPTVKNLSVKDCTYRIYRDTRFSKDKTPYKTHMGAYICPGGKKSGNAGYYFHIEPQGKGFIGGNLLSTGLYMPDKLALQSVREDIAFKGDEFLSTIKKAKGFHLDRSNCLTRVPAGFSTDNPHSEYLKLKDVYVVKMMDNQSLLAPDLLERIVADFKTTLAFNNFLNRAVDFAREEG